MEFFIFQTLQDEHLDGMGSLPDLCPTPLLNENSGSYVKNKKKVLETSDPSRLLDDENLTKTKDF